MPRERAGVRAFWPDPCPWAGEAQLYLMGWRIDCTALHPACKLPSVSVLPGFILEDSHESAIWENRFSISQLKHGDESAPRFLSWTIMSAWSAKRRRHAPAIIVHHVLHADEYPELFLCDTYSDADGTEHRQLISVCKWCHENVCHPERQRTVLHTKNHLTTENGSPPVETFSF